MFDAQHFTPLKDFDEWWGRYRRWIIVMREPSKILKRPPTIGLHIATKQDKMFLPHYEKGGWQDGKPIPVTIGDQPMLIRIPALKIGDRFLILDGVKRLRDRKPAFVLLDYAEYAKGDQFQWIDTYNVYWQRWAKQ